MLRSANEMMGYKLLALDGDIGSCNDFLFEDESWTLQYMIANTGGWLDNRKVLLSPKSLGDPPLEEGRVQVDRTKEFIENAPELDSDAPVSRQYQLVWTQYHGLTPYWHKLGPLSTPLAANAMALMEDANNRDEHLRSVKEVCGYEVEMNSVKLKGQGLGTIVDFILSDTVWQIAFAVLETDSRWFRSRKVLVGRDVLNKIGWAERKLYVDIDEKQLARCPAYDPGEPIEPRLEAANYDLYGMPRDN
jgi:uncharacterized protein YrrD